MRQGMRGIRLEFHAFLEVHQIELHFLWAVIEREIGDERVKQRGFAGTRFAGNEHVMGGSLAEL